LSKPKAPTPPDPTATIAAQSQANEQNLTQNAELNRINQTGPGGSLTYSITGYNPDGTPQYAQDTQLNPQLQNIYDLTQQGATGLLNTAIGMQGQVANAYANPIDASGGPGIASGVKPTGINLQTGVQSPNLQTSLDTSAIPQLTSQVNGGQSWQDAVKQAQDAAYGSQTQYLDPQFAQSQEALDNQLANQGITRGSDAYQTAEDNLARQKQAAYGNAQMQAVQAGNQEQNTLFGQGLSSANLQNTANQLGMGNALNTANFSNSAAGQQFGMGQTNLQDLNSAQAQQYGQNLQGAQFQNQAQQQYLQNLFALRNQPLNEFSALMSGGQVSQPNLPFATGVPQSNVAPVNAAGLINSAVGNQFQNYQQQMAGINNLFSLGGTLGSAAILA
jgi:hypothetical protein